MKAGRDTVDVINNGYARLENVDTFAAMKQKTGRTTTLFVKNMVCSRCRSVVRNEFEKAGLSPLSVELGEVQVAGEPDALQLRQVNDAIRQHGFELIDDRKSRTIAKIKKLIIGLVHHSSGAPATNLSTYIADNLRQDYTYLSNLFSQVEGTTIEKYHIAQRVEKVKELLVYDELSLSEIADQLGYSSTAYLSAQFKKVTGLTPSHFKAVGAKKRRNLEDL